MIVGFALGGACSTSTFVNFSSHIVNDIYEFQNNLPHLSFIIQATVRYRSVEIEELEASLSQETEDFSFNQLEEKL